jgi:D-alanyl-D-alanine carboxypeptidase (penicillin-binding protein 5/6)
VGTKHIDFPGGPGEPDFPVYNDNPLWASYEGFLGGKTGFTDDARHTYVGAAERDGRRIAVVLLQAEQQPIRVAEQAQRLLDYGFGLAAAGKEPVGTVTTAPPFSSVDEDGEGTDVIDVATTSPSDPFGTTGWIVTLIVTVLVLTGLLVGHRKGLLRRPD